MTPVVRMLLRIMLCAVASLMAVGWAAENAEKAEATRTEIQVMLDEASQVGGTVTLAPGEYVIQRSLALRNATLTGPGATIRAVNSEAAGAYLMGIRMGSGSVLRDISLVGEGPRCVPVQISGGSRKVQLRHVTITGGTILIDANAPEVNDILIEGCDLYKGGYGVLLDNQCSGANVRIVGCHFKGNRSDSIELNFPHKEKGLFVRNVVIADSIFEGTGPDPNSGTSGFAVGMAGAHQVQITGNTFYKIAVQGVHLEDDTEYVTVSGNNFEECGMGCTTGNWSGGVHVLSGTKFVTVTGNNFTRCRYGVSGLQGNTLRDITVVGNTFRDCPRGAWFMEYPRGVFQGNILENCGVGLELWRSRRWIVTGNSISADRRGETDTESSPSVGIRCFGYRELICTNNTLDVDVPFDHHNKDWYDQHFILRDNLILRGTSRLNGEPVPAG